MFDKFDYPRQVRHREYTHNGKQVVLDACELFPGKNEVMIMYPNGREIDTRTTTEEAAEEAGTSCFDWHSFGGKTWVFCPNTRGQGNARSRNAEAMVKALKAMGYEAFDYCQMD